MSHRCTEATRDRGALTAGCADSRDAEDLADTLSMRLEGVRPACARAQASAAESREHGRAGMKACIAGLVGIVLWTAAPVGDADALEPVRALNAETERLRAELVVLRRIRSAQRELIEWTRVSEGDRVGGLPAEICAASALRGLCPRLHFTFSIREDSS